jgi:hypothetical protein
MATVVTPYSYLLPFITGATASDTPQAYTWISSLLEQQRLASYDFYDSLYKNFPNTFRLTLRGDEENPIYVPEAKRIIDTMARYVARDMGFAVTAPDETARVEMVTAFGNLFARERFFSVFHAAKKCGLRRGDWVFFIFGDGAKAEGSRISIKSIHPRNYFPRMNEDDTRTGVDLVDLVIIDKKTYVRRQRYLRYDDVLHPEYNPEAPDPAKPVAYEEVVLEQANWDDPEKVKTFQSVTPMELMPEGITQLPVYHIRNDNEEDTYGTSEIQGLERLMLAINQGITDEDVAIALSGLGMYTTNTHPVDPETGESTNWVIGPKRVVELPPNGEFNRVKGIDSVEPSQDHIAYLQSTAESTKGISDVALGTVDVSVAQSGIALKLRMGPLLDVASERDSVIRDVIGQMFYDLRFWYKVYEGKDYTGPEYALEPSFGEKLPRDLEAEWKNLYAMFLDNAITLEFLLQKGTEFFGWEYPDGMVKELQDAQAAAQEQAAAAAGFNDRLGAEAGAEDAPADDE